MPSAYTYIHIHIYITGDIDYYPGSYNIIFPARVTRVSFQVLIIDDDDVIEGTEAFTLSVDTSVLPANARLATPRSVLVTIVDDDCKSLM